MKRRSTPTTQTRLPLRKRGRPALGASVDHPIDVSSPPPDPQPLLSFPPPPSPPAPSRPFVVGTAGWSVPRDSAAHFPPAGSHLQRYSARLRCVEINSSFYQHHQPSTYSRWAACTPSSFLFSAKLHRSLTHEKRLKVTQAEVEDALRAMKELGSKLAVLLVQLPPSLAFDEEVASAFFAAVRRAWTGGLVVEPRHVSWGKEEAAAALQRHSVGRVVADPEVCPVLTAGVLVGGSAVSYFRLHGSPVIYSSEYGEEALGRWGEKVLSRRGAAGEQPHAVWCVFDNTQHGHATKDALAMQRRLDDVGDRC